MCVFRNPNEIYQITGLEVRTMILQLLALIVLSLQSAETRRTKISHEKAVSTEKALARGKILNDYYQHQS